MISESTHRFNAGVAFASQSMRAGISTEGWRSGQIEVTAAVDTHSLVFISPLSQPFGAWWVETVPDEGFIVYSSAIDEMMLFQWLVIGVESVP